MKSLFLTFTFLFLLAASATAQIGSDNFSTDTGQLYKFSETITADFLRKHLSVLSDDSLKGRDTGTPGIEKAADYLADFYETLGFEPKGVDGTYFQPFGLNATVTDSLVYRTFYADGSDTTMIDHSVQAENKESNYMMTVGGAGPIDGDIIFGGFGVDDSLSNVRNLKGAEITNNWVLVFEQIPHIVDGDTLVSTDYSERERLISLIRDYGAKGVLLIPDQSQPEFEELSQVSSQIINVPENLSLAYQGNGRGSFNPTYAYARINPALAAEILGVDEETGLHQLKTETIQNIREFRAEKTSHYLKYRPYEEQRVIEAKNVLALFEGADPEFRDEVVVIMGHYDHVGLGAPDETGDYIYNGADDNGSGTVSLMAIANAFHEAQSEGYKPKRSILFLHVSAEEAGLLGSRYYSDHPTVPIEQTVAALNTDMISRSDPGHIEEGITDYVYLIGGDIISSQLDSLVIDANNQSVNMQIDRGYNDLDDPNQFYQRSDHWNFGRLSVPFAFFFTGVHEDYHRPGDEIHDVDFEKYPRVARLIYNSAVNIANYEKRPEVDNQQFIEITSERPR